MSRDDGFAVADIDSAYFDDSKMRALWQRLRDPDKMARAVCLHQSTLLASWRHGERVTVRDASPIWLAADKDLVRHLKAVKLLDADGRVSDTSWDRWFGAAWSRRAARRKAGSIGGQASGQSRSTDAQASPKQSLKQSLTDAEPDRPSVPSDSPTDLPSEGLTRPSDSPGGHRAIGLVDPSGTPSSWEAAQLASLLGAKP